MKQTVKRIMPEPLWNAARSSYDALVRLPDLPAATLHPWRRESRKRLAALKDIHKGRTLFHYRKWPIPAGD